MRRTLRVLTGMMAVVGFSAAPVTGRADLVGPGDIAFIGFNGDSPDDFVIVLLADAAAGTVVHFNDNEWVGTRFNGSTESAVSWTVGMGGLPAGTVVTFSSTGTATPSVSTGTLTGGNMPLDSAGEAIYAFLGVDAMTPTTFLAAISNDIRVYNGTNGQTLTGTGLTQGSTAILLPASGTNLADGGQYTGARTGADSFADYLALIGNPSLNWAVDANDGTQFVPFNTMSFEITSAAVPEPAGGLLIAVAVGLGLVFLKSTRERQPRIRSPRQTV